MEDEVFVPTEEYKGYGVGDDLSPEQGRQLDQDSTPRQEVRSMGRGT
jgi:hypothetical protein